MKDDMKIVFCLKPEETLQGAAAARSQETARAMAALSEYGFCAEIRLLNEQMELEQDVLPDEVLLTDSGRFCAQQTGKGRKVLGYLHAGNQGESFPGASYLLSEPDEIDADSWQKILERLQGLPWTILTTARCIVRELTTADLDSLYELYDEEALRFIEGMSADREKEREILEAYIREVYGFYGCGVWGIFLKKEDGTPGRLIGRAGYEPFLAGEAVSFGYLIHPAYRRQGYAEEVCSALTQYGKDILGFEAIQAQTAEDNLASIRLLGRIGFKQGEDGVWWMY